MVNHDVKDGMPELDNYEESITLYLGFLTVLRGCSKFGDHK